MNSVMQVLFTIKDFQEKYYKHCDFYFDKAKDPVNDFNAQTAKLAFGLLSGLYSREMPADGNATFKPPSCIRPQMFRSLIGREHSEFSTKHQQDAAEYLEYFIEQVHKHCLSDPTTDATVDPSTCFQFQLEERIYCPDTNAVRYLTRDDSMFRINVPLDASKNMHEVLHYNKIKEEFEKQGKKTNDLPVVRPIIPLTQAIARWAEPEKIDDFKIKRDGPKTTIRKTQRFLTFPDYLLIQLKKYTFNDDWTPRKLDVSMEIPDEIDLNSLRAKGFQRGETPMPDGKIPSCYFRKEMDLRLFLDDEPIEQPNQNQISEVLLQQLVEMGFSVDGCKRALMNTGNNNLEAAMNWVFEHQADPDFNTPYDTSTKSSTSPVS
jgi:ubiquitin carboxyl-terminal hydrolase 5/13